MGLKDLIRHARELYVSSPAGPDQLIGPVDAAQKALYGLSMEVLAGLLVELYRENLDNRRFHEIDCQLGIRGAVIDLAAQGVAIILLQDEEIHDLLAERLRPLASEPD